MPTPEQVAEPVPEAELLGLLFDFQINFSIIMSTFKLWSALQYYVPVFYLHCLLSILRTFSVVSFLIYVSPVVSNLLCCLERVRSRRSMCPYHLVNCISPFFLSASARVGSRAKSRASARASQCRGTVYFRSTSPLYVSSFLPSLSTFLLRSQLFLFLFSTFFLPLYTSTFRDHFSTFQIYSSIFGSTFQFSTFIFLRFDGIIFDFHFLGFLL